VTLGVSLVEQTIKHHCVQGSISAFYYTPVHSVFIAALALVGVALIAIRGSEWKREALLNTAGFLAPVVAFIPTRRPGPVLRCPIDDTIQGIPASFLDNNLTAFIIGGLLALAVVLGLVRLHRKHLPPGLVSKETTYPAIAAGLMLIGLVIWRLNWRDNFETHAHSYSAILMFVLAGIFVFLTGLAATGTWRIIYFSCTALMILGFIVGVITTITGSYYTVLIIEIIEATAFLLFWTAQSVELWDRGIVLIEPATTPVRNTAGTGTATISS
jgi:hypothetical protein